MLDFEFKNSCPSFVVTFCIEEENDYNEVARFRFDSKAFGSVEEALSLFAGLVGNNFIIETAFGYMSITTDEYVYYEDISGVIGHAEVKNPGNIFDEYVDVILFYPELVTVDDIYRLLEEDVDIKSFKPHVEQLFDY